MRNGIGFHYGGSDTEFAKLIADNMTEDDLLESTTATVGGLARMTDPLVRSILNIFNGGDFMADENHTHQVKEALHTISGHLITVVDNLFDALIRTNMDAVVEKHEALVDVPALVIRGSMREIADANVSPSAPRAGSLGGVRESTLKDFPAPGGHVEQLTAPHVPHRGLRPLPGHSPERFDRSRYPWLMESDP